MPAGDLHATMMKVHANYRQGVVSFHERPGRFADGPRGLESAEPPRGRNPACGSEYFKSIGDEARERGGPGD